MSTLPLMDNVSDVEDGGIFSVWTGNVINESPPPAHPMKISFQSSVSRFSIVLPAGDLR